MKLFIVIFISLASSLSYSLTIGETAPLFTLKNQENKDINLSDYIGKMVVLEWLNHGCPFVKKHYNSKNMQMTQKTILKNKDVIWLSIISSSNGKQGYRTPKQAKADMKTKDSFATHTLLDSTGKVGKLYGAKTTPHMYIINTDGKLIYQGAIDSKPSADPNDIKTSKNYILQAFSDIKAQRSIRIPKTKAYGCSVKY